MIFFYVMRCEVKMIIVLNVVCWYWDFKLYCGLVLCADFKDASSKTPFFFFLNLNVDII